MSVILLNGLMERRDDLPINLTEGLPIHRICRVGDLDAIISQPVCDVTDVAVAPEVLAEAAVAHDLVLNFYASFSTVLPVRFATAFSDEARLRCDLEDPARMRDLKEQLRKLHKQHEFSVKIFVSSDNLVSADNSFHEGGRDFLVKRAASRSSSHGLTRRRSDAIARFVTDLNRFATNIQKQAARADRFFALTALVHQSKLEQFNRSVALYSADLADVELEIFTTGPWPAYSFAAGFSPETVRHV